MRIGTACWSRIPIAVAVLCTCALRASAQLKGHYVAGFTGILDGTQPPPGLSVALPLYAYTTDDIRNDDGNSFGVHPRVTATFIGPALGWVTNEKILGGNLGGSIAPVAFIKSRIEGKSLDVPGSFALTDAFVQPVQLGWETARADFMAGYGLFIPTGKWHLGGDDNSGLGMWSSVPQAGTTLYLDDKKQWSVATLASYEIHSRKRGADLKVGDILTLEGGIARTFVHVKNVTDTAIPRLITNVGVAYYGQLKVTSDEAGVATPLLSGREDRVFAAGLEGNMIWPAQGILVDLRLLPEFGARNRTQGWTVMLTAAYTLKSFIKAAPNGATANHSETVK